MGLAPKDEVGILKRLVYRGKKKPSEKISRAKIKTAVEFLMSISKNPSKISINLVKSILKTIEVYMQDFEFKTLDKIILKILNKNYDANLLEYVTNLDDSEILAAYCYIKHKHEGVIDDRIFTIYKDLKGDIKKKIDGILESSGPKIKDLNIYHMDYNPIAIYDDRRSEKSDYCNFYNKSMTNECQNMCCFCQVVPVSKVWNDFKLLKSQSKYVQLSEAISLIEKNKLKLAKESLLFMINSDNVELTYISYSLMALIHFLSLEYHEAMFYLDQLMNCGSYFDYQFTLNCKFLVENYARIPSISSCLSVKFDVDPNQNFNDLFIKENFENKYLMNLIFRDSIKRICLFNPEYPMYFSVDCLITNLRNQMPDYSPLFIFEQDGILNCYDLEKRSNLKMCNWEEFNIKFLSIMYENQKILKFKATSPEEKSYWWMKRFKLDADLCHLYVHMRGFFNTPEKKRVMLILEGSISHFPFEALFDKPALRLLSNDFVSQFYNIEVNKGFYLLDPACNLPNTRETIKDFLKTIPSDLFRVKGVEGRALNSAELQDLSKNDMFLFFGHGSGKSYFEIKEKTPQSLLLFGCSSCKLLTYPNFKPNGYCLRYLNKRHVVLGNLWDVTDKDLDKFTISLLEDFLKGKDIVDSIYYSRNVCKLKYLNSSALVIYGSLSCLKIKAR